MSNKTETRRSVWADGQEGDTQTDAPNWKDLAAPAQPVPVVSQLRMAEAKPEPKRNRQWEQANKATTYRLVPTELREAVKQVAHEIGFSTDQIAQALLTYAMDCYQRNELILTSSPGPHGLTLFPETRGAKLTNRKLAWRENHWNPTPPERKRKRRKSQPGLYQQRVTYRVSESLRSQIAGTAQSHHVPAGEVVTCFLQHALDAYERGILLLTAEDA